MSFDKEEQDCMSEATVVARTTTFATPEAEMSQGWSSHAQNPMNWSATRKYLLVILISLTNVTASVCSTAFEPGIPAMMRAFRADSDSLSSLTITSYLVGYVLGPLVIAPVSELYGRCAVFWPAFVLFMITLVICGTATSLATFIVIRCLMGFAANAFVIVGPAVVADMIPPSQRGLALSVLSSGPVVGPTLGPLLGGLIVQSVGWRWVFWIALILIGVLFVASLFILRETYAPVLQRKIWIQQEQQQQQQQQRRRRSEIRHPSPFVRFRLMLLSCKPAGESPRKTLRNAFIRPAKLFFRVPIVPLLAIYTTVSYVFLQVLFATLGTAYENQYHFSQQEAGFIYLGMTIGFVVGLAGTGLVADRLASYLARRKTAAESNRSTQSANKHEQQTILQPMPTSKNDTIIPELRLPLGILGSVIIIPAIFLYGFTLDALVHWSVPLIATALVACSAVWTYMAVQMYLVDAFDTLAASATGAVSMFRAVGAATIPIAANPAYNRWGYGWGNAIFAFACVPFVPMAIALMIWGAKIRRRFPRQL